MCCKKGFTLIEMLTVVMIIGILTGVALPQYRRAIQKAQATEAVAMLRTMLDSSERLATQMGYRDYNTMVEALDDAAEISRMDMFDNMTINCELYAQGMLCDKFEYHLNPLSPYLEAFKGTEPYRGTEIRLYRGDIPRLTCCPPSEHPKACDVYNIDLDANCGG